MAFLNTNLSKNFKNPRNLALLYGVLNCSYYLYVEQLTSFSAVRDAVYCGILDHLKNLTYNSSDRLKITLALLVLGGFSLASKHPPRRYQRINVNAAVVKEFIFYTGVLIAFFARDNGSGVLAWLGGFSISPALVMCRFILTTRIPFSEFLGFMKPFFKSPSMIRIAAVTILFSSVFDHNPNYRRLSYVLFGMQLAHDYFETDSHYKYKLSALTFALFFCYWEPQFLVSKGWAFNESVGFSLSVAMLEFVLYCHKAYRTTTSPTLGYRRPRDRDFDLESLQASELFLAPFYYFMVFVLAVIGYNKFIGLDIQFYNVPYLLHPISSIAINSANYCISLGAAASFLYMGLKFCSESFHFMYFNFLIDPKIIEVEKQIIAMEENKQAGRE